MDVLIVKLNDTRVVPDGFLILSKFSITISSIVESFNVVWRSELYFIGVVIDCLIKSLQLTVDQSPI